MSEVGEFERFRVARYPYRRKILEQLKEGSSLDLPTLAKAVGMKPKIVNYNLSLTLKAGLTEVDTSSGEKRYRLSKLGRETLEAMATNDPENIEWT